MDANSSEALERLRRSLEEADSRGPSAYEIAVRDWASEDARLHVETRLTEAEERTSAAQEAVDEIGRRIAAMRATTLGGLVFKARYALAHNPSEPDPGVVESILDDLLTMVGEGRAA